MPQLTNTHAQWLLLAGRIFLGMLFVMAGVNKLTGGIDSLASTIDMVTGLPFPMIVALLVIAIEVGAGLLFVFGLWTRRAALAIIIFLIGTIIWFHPGWSDPEQMTNMSKNFALIGGFLSFLASGPGALSLDAKFRGMRSATVAPEKVPTV